MSTGVPALDAMASEAFYRGVRAWWSSTVSGLCRPTPRTRRRSGGFLHELPARLSALPITSLWVGEYDGAGVEGVAEHYAVGGDLVLARVRLVGAAARLENGECALEL